MSPTSIFASRYADKKKKSPLPRYVHYRDLRNHGVWCAMSASAYTKAFGKAVTVLGGVQQLSDYLRVPKADLMRWIKGEAKPTTKAFLDVVDLLSEENPAALAKKKPRPGTSR